MSKDVVLLTGGSGYVGSTTLVQLLKDGLYDVKTTVRDATKKEHLIAGLKHAGVSEEQLKHLRFHFTDLTNDSNWKEAFEGVKFVLHIASPIQAHEKDKIRNASEGFLRVLKFAKASSGVKRFVATSSMLTFVPLMKGSPFAEYHESKIVAEKAGWDFVEKEKPSFELISVHPGIIFGPIVQVENAGQVQLIQELLNGKVSPFLSQALHFADVRDVADAHIRVLSASDADLANAREKGHVWFPVVADDPYTGAQASQLLRDKLAPEYAKNVAVIAPPATPVTNHRDNTKTKTLGWKPHSADETILDTANSLIAFGLVKK